MKIAGANKIKLRLVRLWEELIRELGLQLDQYAALFGFGLDLCTVLMTQNGSKSVLAIKMPFLGHYFSPSTIRSTVWDTSLYPIARQIHALRSSCATSKLSERYWLISPVDIIIWVPSASFIKQSTFGKLRRSTFGCAHARNWASFTQTENVDASFVARVQACKWA